MERCHCFMDSYIMMRILLDIFVMVFPIITSIDTIPTVINFHSNSSNPFYKNQIKQTTIIMKLVFKKSSMRSFSFFIFIINAVFAIPNVKISNLQTNRNDEGSWFTTIWWKNITLISWSHTSNTMVIMKPNFFNILILFYL